MTPPHITVINANGSFGLNRRFIRRLVIRILEILKEPPETEFEVVFLSDGAMRVFNRKYKGADRATDVLSFRLPKDGMGTDAFFGEIFISSDTASRNAVRFGTGFAEELVLYVIHGILHFLGYEDGTPGERARMSRKEKKVLRYLCKNENLSRVLTTR
ncbi:MAG: rRNA maturation RNase YbeY [Candidatus Omnitrophota bacterium]